MKLLANRLAILPALLKRPELPANQEQVIFSLREKGQMFSSV